MTDEHARDYLNDPPTPFVVPPAPVDRLRKAAGTALREASELKRLLRDTGSPVPTVPDKVAR